MCKGVVTSVRTMGEETKPFPSIKKLHGGWSLNLFGLA